RRDLGFLQEMAARGHLGNLGESGFLFHLRNLSRDVSWVGVALLAVSFGWTAFRARTRADAVLVWLGLLALRVPIAVARLPAPPAPRGPGAAPALGGGDPPAPPRAPRPARGHGPGTRGAGARNHPPRRDRERCRHADRGAPLVREPPDARAAGGAGALLRPAARARGMAGSAEQRDLPRGEPRPAAPLRRPALVRVRHAAARGRRNRRQP